MTAIAPAVSRHDQICGCSGVPPYEIEEPCDIYRAFIALARVAELEEALRHTNQLLADWLGPEHHCLDCDMSEDVAAGEDGPIDLCAAHALVRGNSAVLAVVESVVTEP